jgi:hypothetical protein
VLPTTCPARAQLLSYLLRRLDPAACAALETHVEHCPTCQQELEGLTDSSTSTWIKGLQPIDAELPEDATFFCRLCVRPPAARGPSRRRADLPLPEVPGYEILRELGRGGAAVVYLARHLPLRRLVALKMVLAGPHAPASSLQRFEHEAMAVARLYHPNIVQIHEVGTHEGRPYLALEYVAGGSLAQHLTGSPLPPLEAARLVETLARAVQHAHEHGIVHRDLKPSNVLVSGGVASGE